MYMLRFRCAYPYCQGRVVFFLPQNESQKKSPPSFLDSRDFCHTVLLPTTGNRSKTLPVAARVIIWQNRLRWICYIYLPFAGPAPHPGLKQRTGEERQLRAKLARSYKDCSRCFFFELLLSGACSGGLRRISAISVARRRGARCFA